MKAFKCKDTEQRLTVLKILDKMGIELTLAARSCLNIPYYTGNFLYLDYEDGKIWIYSTPPKHTNNLEEFLNQFRTKAYKCKSEEEKIRICELLRDNGVRVGEATIKGDISYPYIAYHGGDDCIIGWRTLEFTSKTIEAATPAEFLKQWCIEWEEEDNSMKELVSYIEHYTKSTSALFREQKRYFENLRNYQKSKQQFPNKPKILPTWTEE